MQVILCYQQIQGNKKLPTIFNRIKEKNENKVLTINVRKTKWQRMQQDHEW